MVSPPRPVLFADPLVWLQQSGEKQRLSLEQLSPQSLAYLGDAVFELYVRTCYLWPPSRLRDYHGQVVAQVKAENQAALLQKLLPYLTETEQEMVRRGRNATGKCPRRLSLTLYQQATSLETLLGYLYLRDGQRLQELLQLLNPWDVDSLGSNP
ncbi:MAG: Mini-ribonuclease 3 [Microcystaceae cyanobacterium]